MSHLEWPDAALRPVLACGAVLGAFCGLVGTFAVARRESLQGDTVAHAALPGLMLAILLGFTGESAWLAGAAASGWLALGVVQLAGSRRPTTPDAALAGGLAVFFGLGVVLMARAQATGSAAGPQRFLFGQAAANLRWADLTPLLATSAVGAATALILWRPLVAASFDPAFGQTVGLSRRLMTVVMTFLVVLAVVAGLQTVGVVLISALLIAPAVAARQWSDRLERVALLASVLGAACGVGGSLLGHALSRPGATVPTGPAIVLTATAVALGSLLLAPKRGLVAASLRRRRALARLVLPAGGAS